MVDSYDAWMAGRRRLIETAVDGIHAPEGIVIDVAGGDGALSAVVASRTGGRLVVNDMSSPEVRRACEAGREVTRADVRSLPFRDDVADVTVAFEIVEHFPAFEAPAFIDELHRITKPGGLLLMSTPNRYSLESWRGLVQYVRHGTIWNARDDTHVTLYSRAALHHLVSRRFNVERVIAYYLLPEFRGHATPWTHTITTNAIIGRLCHKLLIIARKDATGHGATAVSDHLIPAGVGA